MIFYLDYKPVELSVAELYQSVFGVRAIPYLYKGQPAKGVSPERYTEIGGIVYSSADDFYPTANRVPDYLGTTAPLTGDAFIAPTSFGKLGAELKMPLEPMVEVNLHKKILSTPLAGKQRQGTVKELISRDDSGIRLSGVLLFEGESGWDIPVQQLARLNKIYNLDESLQINNPILNAIGITRVVVSGLSYKPVERMNMISYTMELLSDYDFELQLKTGRK